MLADGFLVDYFFECGWPAGGRLAGGCVVVFDMAAGTIYPVTVNDAANAIDYDAARWGAGCLRQHHGHVQAGQVCGARCRSLAFTIFDFDAIVGIFRGPSGIWGEGFCGGRCGGGRRIVLV